MNSAADLGETEDVVNEEQDILALSITEVLCNSQTCNHAHHKGSGMLLR